MAEALPTPLPQRPLIAAIRRAEAVLLYLDFDGTLVPIRQDPSRCQLSPPLRATLQQLSGWKQDPALDLAVISGRSLVDLRQRLGPDLRGLSLAGNHGLEIANNGNVWCEPRAQALQPALQALQRPGPQHRRQRRAGPQIKQQLHPRIGAVHVLTARP